MHASDRRTIYDLSAASHGSSARTSASLACDMSRALYEDRYFGGVVFPGIGTKAAAAHSGLTWKMEEDNIAHTEEVSMTDDRAADHGRRRFFQLAGYTFGVLAHWGRPSLARAQATSAASLKIGSVGAGRMGSALGALLVKAGHPVMFSSRHPENLKDLAARLGPLAHVGTVEQAIAFGDVVVMVVPYAALEEIGKAHGRALAARPLVLDVCNPIARRDGADLVRWVNEQGGAGLATAKLLPGSRIVRAFNGISYRRVGEMAHRPGGLLGVPIAGDDPKAIALAEELIRGMGFEPVLVGGLAMGKYLLPGTPLAEEHTPAELRRIAATLR
jgi:predicted dinucleotide-binding enzyme